MTLAPETLPCCHQPVRGQRAVHELITYSVITAPCPNGLGFKNALLKPSGVPDLGGYKLPISPVQPCGKPSLLQCRRFFVPLASCVSIEHMNWSSVPLTVWFPRLTAGEDYVSG